MKQGIPNTPIRKALIEVGVNRYDISNYPEDVWPALTAFCQLWGFEPPPFARGKKKGRGTDWLVSLRELNIAASEFRIDDLLKEYREEFDKYLVKHNGLAPFTVWRPGSLVNAIAALAARKRLGKHTQDLQENGDRYSTGKYAEYIA
jgi:hypothetical protein